MTVRTIKSSVTFVKSFTLGDFDEVLPSGTYEVESDEELLEGLSFDAYRRIRVLIHLPAKSRCSGFSQTLTIDPNAWDAAIERDGASCATTSEMASVQKLHQETPVMCKTETDLQAVARAENEGMILHPC